jgi:hypothetical protein
MKIFTKKSITYRVYVLGMLVTLGSLGCKRQETFPEIGEKVASPIDVATSTDGKHFFVLNADFDRTYNTGSILTLDEEGNKVAAVKVPRLGRSMTIAGNDMLLTFDRPDDNETIGGQVWLMDISDPADIKFVKSWMLTASADTTPINAAMREGYPYFAVSTLDGRIYAGELKSDREKSTLNLVRNLQTRRRALYIDPLRNLLFAFVTDMGSQDDDVTDQTLPDEITVSDTDERTSEPNEIPDNFEDTRRARNNTARHELYQMLVYDFESEAAEGFPERTKKEALKRNEFRWVYFTTSNYDGTPDDPGLAFSTTSKEYRTNFWEALPDPQDVNSFYLSQRGIGANTHANHIVKASIVGDLVGDGETVPKTADVMTFERVYGFAGELDTNLHYPGDFDIKMVGGRPLLAVNHFRDLVYWRRSEVRFSIATKVLGEHNWFDELTSTNALDSYYQVALNPSGKALTCSFYGHAVILLDITPGAGISEDSKRIE